MSLARQDRPSRIAVDHGAANLSHDLHLLVQRLGPEWQPALQRLTRLHSLAADMTRGMMDAETPDDLLDVLAPALVRFVAFYSGTEQDGGDRG